MKKNREASLAVSYYVILFYFTVTIARRETLLLHLGSSAQEKCLQLTTDDTKCTRFRYKTFKRHRHIHVHMSVNKHQEKIFRKSTLNAKNLSSDVRSTCSALSRIGIFEHITGLGHMETKANIEIQDHNKIGWGTCLCYLQSDTLHFGENTACTLHKKVKDILTFSGCFAQFSEL